MRLTIPLSTLSLVLLFLAAGAKAGEVNVWIVAGQSNADGLVNKDTGTTGPIPTAVDSIIGGSNHVYVHHSRGGTSLHPGYTVRPSWHPSVPGQMYADLVVKLDATLTDIRANGDTPVIRAMFWMQGEQDAKASNIHAGLAPPPQPEAANNYDVYLKDLIAAVRGETGAANLPIIIGETTLGDDPDITYPISDYNTPYGEMDYTPIIQAKQAAVAAGDPWAVLVDTDVSQLGSDYTHFTQQGLDELATDMVTAYTVIPEPATLSLLGLGGAALLRPAKRKRNKKREDKNV